MELSVEKIQAGPYITWRGVIGTAVPTEGISVQVELHKGWYKKLPSSINIEWAKAKVAAILRGPITIG